MADESGDDYRHTVIHISSGSIVKLLVFIALALLIYLVRDIIILVLAALILSMALESWVHWLQGYRVPRFMSVLITFALIFVLTALTVVLLIPPVVNQVSDLIANFPTYYDRVSEALEDFRFPGEIEVKNQIAEWLSKLSSYVGAAATGVFSTVMKIFGGLVSLLAFLAMTIYFVTSADEMRSFFGRIAPKSYQKYIYELMPRVQEKLGYWLRGQVLLCFLVFVLTFIGLSIAGIKYAFLLALVAGIFEIIPFVGPALSAIPAIFFALAQSPVKALLVLGIYVLVQQLENHILVPKVMGKQVDLNPVVVILFLLIGAKLEGILGALLAVPVAAALSIIFTDVMNSRNKEETSSPAKPS
jgi:predicted PurR-regulated permease PerM